MKPMNAETLTPRLLQARMIEIVRDRNYRFDARPDWDQDRIRITCRVCFSGNMLVTANPDRLQPCLHRFDGITANAIRKVRAAGYEPDSKYNGGAYPWKCVCVLCGIRRSTTPRFFASTTCSHNPIEATREIIELGFVPIGPFPGATVGWEAVCTTCNAVRLIFLSKLRKYGIGCNHHSGTHYRRSPVPLHYTDKAAALRPTGWRPVADIPSYTEPFTAICPPCGHQQTSTYHAFLNPRLRCKHNHDDSRAPLR